MGRNALNRAASLAALALLGAVAACGSSSSEEDPPPPAASRPAPSPVATDARVITRVDRRQRTAFALLRTRPEGLPADTRRVLGAPVVGMSWKLAQRIPLTLAGAYWLVPANGHLCVVAQGSMGSPGVGTNCAQTADALAHGIASVTVARGGPGSSAGGARLIVGVAPDEARAVRVHTKGAVATAPVYDHVFVLRDDVAAPPDRLRLVR